MSAQTSLQKQQRGYKVYENYILRKSLPTLYGNVQAVVREPLPENIDFEYVLLDVQNKVPYHLAKGLKKIVVGDFDFLNERDLTAIYRNGHIFLTNIQDNAEDMLDDIVHEIAHHCELKHKDYIYGDGLLEKEFLKKRRAFRDKLESMGYDCSPYDFENVEYDEDLDLFLYQEVGYGVINADADEFFYSPYAATSVQEYYANGFEHHIMAKIPYEKLRMMCPELNNKINNLINNEID